MGYHALGSLEIWDRMVHIIIFDESTDIRMYLYVWFWTIIHQWSERLYFGSQDGGGGGGQQVFSSLQGGEQKILKQLRGVRYFFNIRFQF